ncbi:MAG: glutaredoxin [Nannocystis sp.]|jgi:glutaredoxin 3|nr:glutaredoxin [Nannocystis sp.]
MTKQGSAPRPDEVDSAVVLYVTRFCGYCFAAERHLRRLGAPYVAIDVSSDPTARRWLVELTGQTTVPQIFIRGRSIGGYSDMIALDEEGALAPLLAG